MPFEFVKFLFSLTFYISNIGKIYFSAWVVIVIIKYLLTMINDNSKKESNAFLLNYNAKDLASDTSKHLKEFIRKLLDDAVDCKCNNDPDQPMTMEQCAEFLGIGRTTFSELINSGEIPFTALNPNHKRARKLIKRKDLLDYLEKNKTKSIDEIKAKYNG